MIHLDSSFLIDLLRETAAERPGPVFELIESFDLNGLAVAYPDERFAPAYARLLTATSRGGRPTAAVDLLIATAAVLDDAALVTRNVKDFSRVPGLRVLKY